jgi:hypothetical protein
MLALPSRRGLASLAEAVNAVAPLLTLGLARTAFVLDLKLVKWGEPATSHSEIAHVTPAEAV